METSIENQLKPVSPESSTGIVHEILSRTQEQMGRIPLMYSGMANNPALLDSYIYSYESFHKHAGFTALEQEVIFLSISVENSCEYCVAAHSFVADKIAHIRHDIIHAIRNNTEISDPKIKSLSLFTRAVTRKRGYSSSDDLEHFYEAGYTAKDVLGIIAAVAIMTFSNYYNHIFHTELDKRYSEWAWSK